MTREDNPEYFANVCVLIQAVFEAEDKIVNEHGIRERLKAGTISPDEYVEAIAEEMMSHMTKAR